MALVHLEVIRSSDNPNGRDAFNVDLSRVPSVGEYVVAVRPVHGGMSAGGAGRDEVFRVEAVFHHIGHRAGEPEATIRVLIS